MSEGTPREASLRRATVLAVDPFFAATFASGAYFFAAAFASGAFMTPSCVMKSTLFE